MREIFYPRIELKMSGIAIYDPLWDSVWSLDFGFDSQLFYEIENHLARYLMLGERVYNVELT